MLGSVAAGVAVAAFILAAVLQLSPLANVELQGFVVYLGFAAIAVALFDLSYRRNR